MIAKLLICFWLIELSPAVDKPEESRYKGSLPCDDLQRCLNKESRACWKKFHNEGRKKDDLVGDVLKACPETDFMDFVDRTEAELWPEFVAVDKNLTECMTEAGFRVYLDFCGSMRSVNYSEFMERAVETARKEPPSKPEGARQRREAAKIANQSKSKDDGDKCWINALKTCVSQYPPPNENINTALTDCEKDKQIAESEERLGFEVGKRVMLKIVTKIKEAFDKDEDGNEDEHENEKGTGGPKGATKQPTTQKP